ncbi:MAG: acetyl-CoA acetyltransferase [Chloroflexi bacterium RBG_16_57_9]|nr:MAG: acetyl-CoA acetyltransferase [Chloroflexi bacterium RBG_16_57_9]
MRDVSIIGIGQVPVAEHWDKSLRDLAVQATRNAMKDAGIHTADSLYVTNMLSGVYAGQEHLGALIADFAGLRGIEALKIEAACGSGGAGLVLGYMAVASGLRDFVIVTGVEKMTDTVRAKTTTGLATAADADYESDHGVSFVALNALVLQRYMYEFKVERERLANFAINGHRNAVTNPNALLRFPITREAYLESPMVAEPLTLLDCCPTGDGSAAVVLAPRERAHEFTQKPVHIRASAIATDAIALHDRKRLLQLAAAQMSSQKAYKQAGVGPQDIDIFEVHDAFTSMACVSLEACGFAEPGCGWTLAEEGHIALDGKLPIQTMGGLKARGHPVGTTGLYQIVELTQQLRGEAGKNQVKDARLGMAQSVGGSGATIVTHILEADA